MHLHDLTLLASKERLGPEATGPGFVFYIPRLISRPPEGLEEGLPDPFWSWTRGSGVAIGILLRPWQGDMTLEELALLLGMALDDLAGLLIDGVGMTYFAQKFRIRGKGPVFHIHLWEEGFEELVGQLV